MTSGFSEDMQHAAAALESGVTPVELDLSAVKRIDFAELHAMSELAEKARRLSAPVLLRGVRIDVYRVLKLMKIENQFRFV